jgi:hypothetical protein
LFGPSIRLGETVLIKEDEHCREFIGLADRIV